MAHPSWHRKLTIMRGYKTIEIGKFGLRISAPKDIKKQKQKDPMCWSQNKIRSRKFAFRLKVDSGPQNVDNGLRDSVFK